MVYDIRYNVVASHYKHNNRAPIQSLQVFQPSKQNINLNRSDNGSPLLLIASGSSNYELSLFNMATQDIEILLTVDDKQNKEGVLSSLP